MAQYTIEDIEIIRQKSGISYEEAVNLLEYHNGSLARALVDLEKNGRIRDSKAKPEGGRRNRHGLFNYLFRLRVQILKGNVTIVNLSVLFLILVLLMAPWVIVIGAILALLLGYRFSFDRDSRDFSEESFEDMMKNAGSNVRNTVFTIARDFGGTAQNQDKTAGAAATAEPETRSESPASGTTPVNVQFSEDGNVRVTETRDGYHEADIQ
ncbi:MAG TPA: hypothetical protein PLP25_03630 [Candidatus Limiplasma sp.]|nr:hypothetical protein [Candidatus Limiplasma sp.]HPS80937.1 hypothetical protein [Candidatus Limiplasma sp.]